MNLHLKRTAWGIPMFAAIWAVAAYGGRLMFWVATAAAVYCLGWALDEGISYHKLHRELERERNA